MRRGDRRSALANPKTLELAYFHLRWAFVSGDGPGIERALGLVSDACGPDSSSLDQMDQKMRKSLEALVDRAARGDFSSPLHAASALWDDRPSDRREKAESDRFPERELASRFVSDVPSVFGRVPYRVVREMPTANGPCDVVVLEEIGGTLWVVELKAARADHSLVSQVAKYAIAMEKNLLKRMYSEVKMMTVCGGYHPHTLRELRRIEVVPLVYTRGDDGTITYADARL